MRRTNWRLTPADIGTLTIPQLRLYLSDDDDGPRQMYLPSELREEVAQRREKIFGAIAREFGVDRKQLAEQPIEKLREAFGRIAGISEVDPVKLSMRVLEYSKGAGGK